jgi:predicted flap endonuclease-1-like 5' DNA nuclease
MSQRKDDLQSTDLPKIGAPATRALNGAGYTRLEQLTQATEAELMALHGFGPRALRILKEALAARGLALKG